MPWLTLKSIPGIGNLLFSRLTDCFGTPEQVLRAPEGRLIMVEGITARLARQIKASRASAWATTEIERAHRQGFEILTLESPVYPDLLKHIPDPPPVLYTYGSLTPLACPIAVVGSRRATGYGRNTTQRLCAQLAERGAVVVSGMARGIDTAAHMGALNGGGRTVAVLGSGLDQVYPAENLKLFHQIADNGCVITEFALDARPEAHHFPMRNRIISGMSLGTVVVEAARKSGSLITARLAAEQNREVFAVPGSVDAANAKGTHDLIKQGAKLVECADDVLEEITPQLSSAGKPFETAKCLPPLSEAEQAVFAAIEVYPAHIDQLVRDLNMPIGELTGLLSRLELYGVIQQAPGKQFVRHPDFADARMPSSG
ncbi:MAG: DNA-protecting protein DprA [Desulfatitalea sp.]|nr:DNA-processing protein DprA [Desulfatitalea sp.]NNK01553.1 DNA-protecting protein DprA [Desulfatitalea sp.]